MHYAHTSSYSRGATPVLCEAPEAWGETTDFELIPMTKRRPDSCRGAAFYDISTMIKVAAIGKGLGRRGLSRRFLLQ
jgi:hypothetical protein